MSNELPQTTRIETLIDRLRRPEYTGENRCTPCTAVNLFIGAIASVLAGVFWLPAGALVAGVSVGAIYLRGYLVPYTPTLTKRYFPDRVLRWFDKAPDSEGPTFAPEELDVEAQLYSMDAITECADGTDLCLDPTFGRAWHREMTQLRTEDHEDRAAAVAELFDLDADLDATDVETFGHATVVSVDGRKLARWESEAALVADLAADRVLHERHDEWDTLPVPHRSELLGSLRLFLDRCPVCDAPVSLVGETVESCCRERQVAAVTCEGCDARLFETDLPEEMANA